MNSTRKRVSYILFAWVAVTALLLTTACTKKRNHRQGPPPPVVNAPAPSVEGVEGEEDDLGKEVGEGEFNENDPIRLEPVPEEGGGEPLPESDEVLDGQVVFDPRGMKPDAIYKSSEDQGETQVSVPAETEDGSSLYYSGSGQDFLHEKIAQFAPAGEDDLELANSIGLAKFEVDWKSRTARATVPVTKSNGKVAKLQFTGKLSNSLRLIGGDLNKRGGIRLEAVCMDIAGGCNTVHMKIEKKISKGNIATAHVLARNTDAWLFIDGALPGSARNVEYDRFMQTLLNTVHEPGTADTVRTLRFFTSEVIHAKSDFMVLMQVGAYAEPLVLRGGLVKPQTGSHMNLVLDSVPTRVSSVFRETHLTRNDGRGNLQFDITVRKGSAIANEDTIRLTIARVHTDVRALILK